ncbi:MAG: rhodanese-like domain-containing protein [Minisyncoccota bacterium]
MGERSVFFLSMLVTIVATALLIYLTPLRHIMLVTPTMREMDPKEFYTEFSANPDKYMLVDVRSPSIFTSAHAKGAINIPIENLYDERNTLPRTGKQIALICTTGRLAAVGYGYLESQGFTNLIHIEGGMVNWVTEGLPVEGENITNIAPADILDEHQ